MASDHLLLFGHSHANCAAAALHSWDASAAGGVEFEMVAHGSTSLPGALVVEDANRQDIINPILLKSIDSCAGADPERRIWLVSMVAGNYAAELSMFRSADRWSTLLPGEDADACAVGSRFIHYDTLLMTLDRKLAHFRRFLAALPMTKLAGFIHVEAPPPVRDPTFMIEKMPEKSKALARSAGISELTVDSIADAGYRKRVWICQSHAIRRAVEEDRRYYLAPPPDAVDPDGFIVDKLRKDPSHANHEYGRMVLAQLVQFVDSRKRL